MPRLSGRGDQGAGEGLRDRVCAWQSALPPRRARTGEDRRQGVAHWGLLKPKLQCYPATEAVATV